MPPDWPSWTALILTFLLGLLIGDLLDLDLTIRLIPPRLRRCIVERRTTWRTGWRSLGMIFLVATLGLAVGSVAIVVSVLRSPSRDEVAEYQACIGEYNQQLAANYVARIEVTSHVAEASDRAWLAMDRVFNSLGSRQKFRVAAANYEAVRADQRAARREQIQAQKAHPPPPLPRDECGPAPATSEGGTR